MFVSSLAAKQSEDGYRARGSVRIRRPSQKMFFLRKRGPRFADREHLAATAHFFSAARRILRVFSKMVI
jgi:hypothetical protein